MDELNDQDKADAVVAALVGGAMSKCPQCNEKTLSSRVFRDDHEHPDQLYRCQPCRIDWWIFMPEGHIRSIKNGTWHREPGLIALDPAGNHYKSERYNFTRARPNFVFTDTLTWVNDAKMVLQHFTFRRKSTGTTVGIMARDFKLFLPLMVHGSITGTFMFRNVGGITGVTLYKEKPPPKPRKSRAKNA